MSNHTPKWTTAIGPTYAAVCEQNGRTIANIDQPTDRDAATNARLIAAAPDLLEAARAVIADIDGAGVPMSKSQIDTKALRAAIAKAEGGN